jgi:hypothetical protein
MSRLGPHRGCVRTTVAFVGPLVGFIAFVGIPLWVLAVVRAK